MSNEFVLVIYSDFENLPVLQLIPSDSPEGKIAATCNGLVVNTDQEFTEDQVDFVGDMSSQIYAAQTDSESFPYAGKWIVTNISTAKISCVVNVGFAP